MHWFQKYTGFWRRVKPLYVLYNLTAANKLRLNTALYQRFGLKKSVLSSLDSRDFENIASPFKPWLDEEDLCMEDIKKTPGFEQFNPSLQEQILLWPERGFLIWKNFYTTEQAENLQTDVASLLSERSVDFNYTGRKIMQSHERSAKAKAFFHNKDLLRLLEFLLGRKPIPFQTINFIEGSGQKAHADVMHMNTFPKGFLIAAWLALEDVHEGAGPLFYYPGSHRWPYIGNKEAGLKKDALLIDAEANAKYEAVVEAEINRRKAVREVFLPQKGDLLIWHANLLHGGMPVAQTGSTRKSMVAHYFAEGVICYHEISQRPALLSGVSETA
jgi:ectoine hydroxylase